MVKLWGVVNSDFLQNSHNIDGFRQKKIKITQLLEYKKKIVNKTH